MLQEWPRKHFQPGGGNPFLFYVIYGPITPTAVASNTYRVTGIPEGIGITHYSADKPDAAAGFREGYLWEELLSTAPDFAQRVSTTNECLIIRGEPSDSTNLNYLRDIVGLITHFLDHGAVCAYDPQMFHWWKPDEWRQRIFDPAGAVPRHHVIILVSEEATPGLQWFHTRGIRKFGRPDLSMHNVLPSQRDAVVDLFNRFIEHLAFGLVIPEGQPIRMKSLPDGLKCRHAGDLDDPDFNNVHIEIVR